MDITRLTDKQEKFCLLYVENYNGMKAYMEAYPNVKSEASAKSAASRLLNNVNVQDYIAEVKTDFSKLCGITIVSQIKALQVIIDDKETPIRNRIDAMKEQSKLLGLYPSGKTEIHQRIEQPLFPPITGFNIILSDKEEE